MHSVPTRSGFKCFQGASGVLKGVKRMLKVWEFSAGRPPKLPPTQVTHPTLPRPSVVAKATPPYTIAIVWKIFVKSRPLQPQTLLTDLLEICLELLKGTHIPNMYLPVALPPHHGLQHCVLHYLLPHATAPRTS